MMLFSWFALNLVACGGDSSSNGKLAVDDESYAESFDDLPNCSKNREGKIYKVISEQKNYRCIGGRWEEYGDVPDSVKTEDDLPACLEKREGEIAFISKDSTAWGCFSSRWEKIGKAYENTDNLPNCSEKREGLAAYIMEDGKILICSDGKWINEKPESPNQGEETKAEEKSSSSNKISSSSVTEKKTGKSSSSESKKIASEDSLSSDEKTSLSSETQSSNSAETKVSYGILTDERDGRKYKTVKVGEQIWMAENLNYDYKIDGKRYGSYCYDDEPDSCAIYGKLYTWAAAMDSAALFSEDGKGCGDESLCNVVRARGICPENWHLPTVEDWYTLFVEISGEKDFEGIDATSLKTTIKWRDNGMGSDLYGFSILPAGGYFLWGKNVVYRGEGGISFFWTSGVSPNAVLQVEDSVYLYPKEAYEAYSIRCIKNIYKETSYSHIDVKNRVPFEIPTNTIVTATMPKCDNMLWGELSCYDKMRMRIGGVCYLVKIGDVEKNTCDGDYLYFSGDFVSDFCEKDIEIISTGTIECKVDFHYN